MSRMCEKRNKVFFSKSDKIVVIMLTQNKTTIIDLDDYDRIMNYRWYAVRRHLDTWYAVTTKQEKMIYMHRLILNINGNERIDHKNLNGLDNRKDNLRKATVQQNNYNLRKRMMICGKLCSSRYKGVYWKIERRYWVAQIKINGKTIRLGSFDSEEEAARSYDTKAIELFGEYARINFPK